MGTKVAPLMPCRRHTSAVAAPASCSFNIPMICSSLNLLRFIRPSLAGSDSTEKWRHSRGARHPGEWDAACEGRKGVSGFDGPIDLQSPGCAGCAGCADARLPPTLAFAPRKFRSLASDLGSATHAEVSLPGAKPPRRLQTILGHSRVAVATFDMFLTGYTAWCFTSSISTA